MTSAQSAGSSRNTGGSIEIARSAILSIVRDAVLSCYGIVDMVPTSFGSALTKRLGLSREDHGIAIEVEDHTVTIELWVVMEYGTPLFAVARNVMESVTFQVERTLGMTVHRVNVNVDGLRVSAGDPRDTS